MPDVQQTQTKPEYRQIDFRKEGQSKTRRVIMKDPKERVYRGYEVISGEAVDVQGKPTNHVFHIEKKLIQADKGMDFRPAQSSSQNSSQNASQKPSQKPSGASVSMKPGAMKPGGMKHDNCGCDDCDMGQGMSKDKAVYDPNTGRHRWASGPRKGKFVKTRPTKVNVRMG